MFTFGENFMNYNNVVFEAAFGTSSQLGPSELPEVVFAGRSNVGKSSLLNRLFNRKALARVSSEPGKTITVNFYRLDNIRFVDLPGYGFAKRPQGEKRRWADLMEAYFHSGRDIRLVVQLIDMRHEPSADDMTMLNFLIETNYNFLVVLTKCDKLKPMARKEQRARLKDSLSFIGGRPVIEVSAVSGEGIDELRGVIEGLF